MLTKNPLLNFLIGGSLTGRVAHWAKAINFPIGRGRRCTEFRARYAVAWQPTPDFNALEQALDWPQATVNIGEREYYAGNGSEFAAIGNVAVTTPDERLFLRQP